MLVTLQLMALSILIPHPFTPTISNNLTKLDYNKDLGRYINNLLKKKLDKSKYSPATWNAFAKVYDKARYE